MGKVNCGMLYLTTYVAIIRSSLLPSFHCLSSLFMPLFRPLTVVYQLYTLVLNFAILNRNILGVTNWEDTKFLPRVIFRTKKCYFNQSFLVGDDIKLLTGAGLPSLSVTVGSSLHPCLCMLWHEWPLWMLVNCTYVSYKPPLKTCWRCFNESKTLYGWVSHIFA